MSRRLLFVATLLLLVFSAVPVFSNGLPHDHLLASTPQGKDFMLAKTCQPKDADDFAALDRMGYTNYVQIQRHIASTDGNWQWYICAYDVSAPFTWPKNQLPSLVMSDGSTLQAVELLVHTGPPFGQYTYLGKDSRMVDPSSLEKVRTPKLGDREVLMLHAAFPRQFKVQHGSKSVDWSPDDVVSIRFGTNPSPTSSLVVSPH